MRVGDLGQALNRKRSDRIQTDVDGDPVDAVADMSGHLGGAAAGRNSVQHLVTDKSSQLLPAALFRPPPAAGSVVVTDRTGGNLQSSEQVTDKSRCDPGDWSGG